MAAEVKPGSLVLEKNGTSIHSLSRRDSIGYIQLLEGVFERFPAKEWVLIADNLSTHISKDTQAGWLLTVQKATDDFVLPQMLFIPKYCCWLNLIEPWWKQLRSLALKGRRRILTKLF